MLEKISSFSVEQAKEYLLNNLESELVHEKAVKVREFQQQTKEEADQSAREIIAPGHPAVRRGPCERGGHQRGAPAQRRDEGPDHRP